LLRTLKRVAATGFASAALFATVAAPASAQPIVTGGLVNVTVTNVLNNNTILSYNDVNVGVALNLAANICNVSVGVLAQNLGNGTASCQTGDQLVRIVQNA